MVTRALRARLSYASYKATHNIPHVPLRDLEAQTQSQSQSASFSRTIAAKRKAAGTTNSYNNPATQGSSSAGASNPTRRGGSGAMAPPSISTPRSHYPSYMNAPSSSAGYAAAEVASGSKITNYTPTLYTSILAPPPSKQARTIHNVHDPPVPAPTRPAPSPRPRAPKASPRTDPRGGHGKGRQSDKATKAASSPDRRKAKRASAGKGKQKQRAGMDIDVDGDVDMKAAATLTSLLLHHRPSITGSASSPRSSIDGSEASTFSYSHFAQSSARTTNASQPPPPPSSGSSASVGAEPSFRQQTPPPLPSSAPLATTPRPAPTDNEAADLMLFLATSPSPVRPSNKDSKDLAAYRALSGGTGPLRSKGRVLFPSAAGDAPPDNSAAAGSSSPKPASTLLRGGEGGSFTSSISSIGGEMAGRARSLEAQPARVASSFVSPSPAQLLPPPPFPLPVASASPVPRKDRVPSPKPNFGQGTLDFNFHEFINASPSPSRGLVVQGNKSNLGLRADVGRKLFEEEQMRHHLNIAQSPGTRQDERALGAGIDLVQS